MTDPGYGQGPDPAAASLPQAPTGRQGRPRESPVHWAALGTLASPARKRPAAAVRRSAAKSTSASVVKRPNPTRSEVAASASDKPNNPAVQVSVTEAGKEEWKGWLYSMHPGIHPYAHERIAITLVGGVNK